MPTNKSAPCAEGTQTKEKPFCALLPAKELLLLKPCCVVRLLVTAHPLLRTHSTSNKLLGPRSLATSCFSKEQRIRAIPLHPVLKERKPRKNVTVTAHPEEPRLSRAAHQLVDREQQVASDRASFATHAEHRTGHGHRHGHDQDGRSPVT